MTLEQLDSHIKNYLIQLKKAHALKGIDYIYFNINRSKKSASTYIKLIVIIADKPYTKTLRFSDHPISSHKAKTKNIRGLVIKSKDNVTKKELKHIESKIRKEINKLVRDASIAYVLDFRAGDQ